MAISSIPSSVIIQQANGNILVSWSFIAGATSYSVQRSVDQINFTTVGSPTAPQYLDTAATPGIRYYYQIASVNASGTSSYSAPVNAVSALSGQVSLGELRMQAQLRSDLQNSQYITTPEWNSYINQSYFELFDILVQKYGNEYFVANAYQVTTGGSAFYPLPDGSATYLDVTGATAKPFYKLLGVDLSINASTNAWLTLKKFEFISRNRYVFPQITSNLLGVAGMKYRLIGNKIEFIPTPSANQVIQIWYIPRLTQLLQDTDLCDGVSGWTEYIIVDTAIKALQKEESDVSVLMAQKMALLDRIEAAAENRDAGEPERISATRNLFNYGNGFDGPTGGN